MSRLAIPAILLVMLMTSMPSDAGINVVYDFADHFGDAKIANALSSGARYSTVGGVRKQSISLHPTTGETTATYKVPLPGIDKSERLALMFSAGISDGITLDDPKNPFDGVRFRLRVNGEERFNTELKETKWVDGAADLSSLAGKQVEVVFVTDPNANCNYDWAVWGNPRILKLSNSLWKSISTVETIKGIVVVDWVLSPNSVQITPTGVANAQAGISWTSPENATRPPNTAVMPFDFTDTGATGIELSLTDLIGNIEVYEFTPDLQITSFGPSSHLVFGGDPVEFRCTVKNVGEGVLPDSAGIKAMLSIGDKKLPAKALGALMPGASKILAWETTAPTGNFVAKADVTGKDVQLSTSLQCVASNQPVSLPSKVTAAECKQLSDGTIVLQNPKLRMIFLNSKGGYTGWMLSIPKGNDWQTVASGSFGRVVVPSRSVEPVTYQLHPGDLKLVGESNLVYLTTEKRIGNSQCHFEWIFEMDSKEPRVNVTHQMTANQPVDILHFSGPMMYVGDNGFGGAKDEALFPGLEYLLSESSSGTENASPPYNLRTVPHPNKVTIPLMAVRNGKALVSMEWDPLQKWDGAADRPAAVFASPNFPEAQENHAMGIFAPSVPDWTPENKETAEKPYTLTAGKSIQLKADIIVKPDSTTVLDAVDGWIARHGLPDPPDLGKKPYELMELSDSSYLGSAWDEKLKGWKHTNTWDATFDSMVATYMWHRANNLRDAEKRQRIMDVVQPAVEKAKDGLSLDIALLAGGVEGALQRMAGHADGLMKSQRPDGSWPFMPDEKHAVFGKTGDTSSGWSANHAVNILHYALVTGDAKAIESGLRALKYLDTQTRPEGAQTWELQLHVPDILASGRLVDAYLCGYEITGDKKYLDKAVYWAKSGLPFVYLWNAPDRSIMRYGTIPVFGVTWFDAQPWFGVIVQWCGMDYAYSLDRLSDYDKSLPWPKIAEGILNCGIQQQEYITKDYPADCGMYPDAYSPVKGKEEYHWDLNPRLISRLLLRQIGSDPFPYTVSVKDSRGSRLALTIPAQGGKLSYRKEWLTATFPGTPGATCYAVLSGVRAPTSIEVNGKGIPEVMDLEKAEQGWRYIPEKALTILKYQAVAENSMIVDLLNHETAEP